MAKGKGGAGKWIAIGCVVFVLLGACCGGIGFFLYQQTFNSDAAQMTRGFFGNLRRGEHQQALQRMNAQYQSTHALPTFQQNVQQIPALTQQTDASFSNVSVSGGTASVTGTLSTPSGDAPFDVILSEQNGYWYIDTVTVQGQLLQ